MRRSCSRPGSCSLRTCTLLAHAHRQRSSSWRQMGPCSRSQDTRTPIVWQSRPPCRQPCRSSVEERWVEALPAGLRIRVIVVCPHVGAAPLQWSECRRQQHERGEHAAAARAERRGAAKEKGGCGVGGERKPTGGQRSLSAAVWWAFVQQRLPSPLPPPLAISPEPLTAELP
eukprot:scaffold39096_cov23-Tisochrysis_lutea.AAC.2